MRRYLSKIAVLVAMASGGMVAACAGAGPVVVPFSAGADFDTAHEFAAQGGVAQADLPACLQADGGPQKCDALNKDLCAIMKLAAHIESAAVDAGYKPGPGVTVDTLPPTCSN